MWIDDPSGDAPGPRRRAVGLLLALALAAGCGGNEGSEGAVGRGTGGESGRTDAGSEASGGGSDPKAAEAGSPGVVQAGDPLPAPIADLVEALGAVPAELAVVSGAAAREASDPPDWPAPVSVGGEPVRVIREFHPTTGVLLRLAAARPAVAEGSPPVLHGPEWRFHESGMTRSIQWWRDDVPHGPLKQWRPVGVLAREGVFSNGQRDGLWRAYSKNGQLVEQSVFRAGQPEGERRAWFASGSEKELERFRDGELEGERKVWGRDGLLVLQEHYSGGVLDGRWSDFHQGSGSPRQWGEYREGLRTGTWTRASAGGVTLSTAEYRDGALHGLLRKWSDEGTLIEETTYADGEKTGPSLTWYADGTPQSAGELENGRRIGRWTYWKSDGALNERWSGVFEDDQRVAPLEPEPGESRPPEKAPR